jgi:hypothetical protein
MSVFQRVRMPSLDGATGSVKSDPPGPAELRGHVVLVNFWTLTCINWLRQEPYVRAWSQAYRDDGLLVVGVHHLPPACPAPEGPGQLPDSSALKEETLMAHRRETTQGRPDGARSIEEPRIAGPHDGDEIDAADGRGRRWYQLRPEPRRGSDLMGFNSTWWMALVWLIVIVLAVSPFPWWW